MPLPAIKVTIGQIVMVGSMLVTTSLGIGAYTTSFHDVQEDQKGIVTEMKLMREEMVLLRLEMAKTGERLVSLEKRIDP